MALASGESFFLAHHWNIGSLVLNRRSGFTGWQALEDHEPRRSAPPPRRAAKRTPKLNTIYRMREFRPLCLVLSARWNGTQMDHSYRAFRHPHPKTRSTSQYPHTNTLGFNVQGLPRETQAEFPSSIHAPRGSKLHRPTGFSLRVPLPDFNPIQSYLLNEIGCICYLCAIGSSCTTYSVSDHIFHTRNQLLSTNNGWAEERCR